MPADSSGDVTASARNVLRSPHLLLVLAMTSLAANFVVVRGIYEQCPPSVLSMWRFSVAALILLPFTWSTLRKDWPTIQKNWGVLISCAVLMAVIGGQVAYMAMAETVAVNGAIIQCMVPVFIVLISGVLLIDRIKAKQVLGLGIAAVGVLGLITRGDPEILLRLRFNVGDVILLISGCGLAGYTVLIKRSPIKLPPHVFLAVICGIGAILHIPFVAFEMFQGLFMIVNKATVLSILFLAVFPTVLALLFYNLGVAKLGPNRAGVYMYSVPVITALFAFLFLGEPIATYHVIGTIVIVVGIYLTVRATSAPIPKPTDVGT